LSFLRKGPFFQNLPFQSESKLDQSKKAYQMHLLASKTTFATVLLTLLMVPVGCDNASQPGNQASKNRDNPIAQPKIAPTKKKKTADGPRDFFYDDGKTKRGTIHYKDGKKHGPAKEFYESGTLRLEGQYEDDIKQGRFVWYHPTGEKYQVSYYDFGMLDGWDSVFYKSGNPKSAVPYSLNKVVEGTAEWDMYKKKSGAPPIKIRTVDNMGKDYTFIIYAHFDGPITETSFEMAIIGTGTKDQPQYEYEPMLPNPKNKSEGAYIIEMAPGYEWVGKVVIRGTGKTKNGNPFVTRHVFPLVIR